MVQSSDRLSLLNAPPFTAADRILVAHLRDEWGESNSWILLAVALCSLAAREGNAYLDLSKHTHSSVNIPRSWPSSSDWAEAIANSPVVRLENETNQLPLVFCDNHALYLEKYYQHEQRLAALLRQRSSEESSFSVITGGPGTGKTTQSLQYLNTLLENWNQPHPPRFATVAPTGKAAARLAESIAQGVAKLDLSESRKNQLLSIPCLTIHRLLGTLPNRVSFRHNVKRPIAYDTLVIDESSMIDLPLMLRLFEALPSNCQVLLLGDKDQLSSVDVGSVLSDMLEASQLPTSPLHNKITRLTKTYRFSEDSSIYRACQFARLGDTDGFATMLDNSQPDFAFHPIKNNARAIPESAIKKALTRHEQLAACESPDAALAILSNSIVLCPTRKGPFGSIQFNQTIERRLAAENPTPSSQYPIIVLENNYEFELFNGDIGVIWNDSAFFPSSAGELRKFRLTELPRHESAFALTIHKSQGSEFTETIVLIGPNESQLLTRELIYTAFSRAKEKLTLYANKEVLAESIARKASRATRLAELLK